MQEGEDIQHPFLTRAIENAQRKVEAMNFDIRKQLLEYDNVMNKQREMVYSLRNQILSGEDVSKHIQTMVDEALEEKMDLWTPPKALPETWDINTFHAWMLHTFNHDGGLKPADWAKLSREELQEKSQHVVQDALKARDEELGNDLFRHLQRMVLLQMIDVAWKEHLYDLDQLKKGISLRAYAQKDPLIEFQKEAFNLFTQMMNRIREQTLEYMFKMHVGPADPGKEGEPEAPLPVPRSVFSKARAVKPEFEGPAIAAQQSHDALAAVSSAPSEGGMFPGMESEEAPKPQPVVAPEKIGRNDPCPCGSGKKYKKCHGH
jgi:preprotein translocase subunit SecA